MYLNSTSCGTTNTFSRSLLHELFLLFVDFVLTYQDNFEKKKGVEDTEERKDKRKTKRNQFIENCKVAGLKFEHQDCSVSILD